jgi:hypothetical protein
MTCTACGQEYSIGAWPYCPHDPVTHQDAQIHSSEQVTYYENAKGEVIIPGRGDHPIHPKYVQDGYVQRKATTITQVKEVERKSGSIMVARHYDQGGATFDRAMGCK